MKFIKKKKLNHIINENPLSIELTRKEYEDMKKVFCQAKKWKYSKDDVTVNLRHLIINGNYKWHPTFDIAFDIEVEQTKNNVRKMIEKSLVHNPELELHKPYKSIPGDKI